MSKSGKTGAEATMVRPEAGLVKTEVALVHQPIHQTTPHAPQKIGAATFTPCAAKTRTGASCRMPAMANGKCRMHGGKALSGVASATYKGAGRSRVVPARWSDAYKGAVDDPDLLSLRHDIAVVDAQIEELEGRLPEQNPEDALFLAFLQQFARSREFRRISLDEAVKPDNQAKAHHEFIAAFDRASGLYNERLRAKQDELEIMGRTMELREQRRRLVDTETKRLTAAVQSMRVESVKSILWALLDILRREIPDRKLLQRIQDRFRAEFQTLAGRQL